MLLRPEKLNKIPQLFLSFLNRAEINYLKAAIEYRHYDEGSYIFEEGDPIEGIFYIKRGSVSIYKNTILGTKLFISSYHKGDYFGYNSLFLEDFQNVTAKAELQMNVSFVSEEVITSLLTGSPTLLHNIIGDLELESICDVSKS